MDRRALPTLVMGFLPLATMAAQTQAQLDSFHDNVVALIGKLATRPLTPGDTFLTFNPQPGGLTHTIRVGQGLVESSLLRADRMMGTARVEWTGGGVSRFEILWTRADTLRGAGVDSAIAVRGYVDGDSIRITLPRAWALALPSIPWAVADFGMEEQLIPLFRSLPSGQAPKPVALLRPYHLRWDTVTVMVRDSAGLRLAVTLGRDKAREVWITDQDGQLLYVRRMDQPGDRMPLPESGRYAEMRRYAETIRALLVAFPPPNPKEH